MTICVVCLCSDSQEFLRCIIDNLHEGMKHQMPQVEHVKRSRRPSCPIIRSSSSTSQDDDDEEEEEEDNDAEKPANVRILSTPIDRAGSLTNALLYQSGRAAAARSSTSSKTKLMDVSLVSDLFQGSLLSAVECR